VTDQLKIAFPVDRGTPRGWTETTLGALLSAELMNGRSVPTADAGFPVLRLTALSAGLVDLTERKIGAWTRSEAEKYLVREGDFLISRGNGSIRLVGRGALVLRDEEVAFPDTMIRVRPNLEAIECGFLRYQWDAPATRSQIERAAKTTAGIFKINQTDLRRTRLNLAPLAEQRRIVAEIETQFTRLDAAVSTLERVQANLKRARASVLKAAVEGRLVPTEADLARGKGRSYEPASALLDRILEERRRKHDEAQVGASRKRAYKAPAEPETEGLPDLPEGWTWATVEQVSSHLPRAIQSGPFGSNLRHSEFQDDGYLVIGIDNVLDGVFSMGAAHRISEEKFRDLERFRARPLDVAITVMATVGRCCVIPEDVEPAIITKHVYRITVERAIVLPRYLMYVLKGAPPVRRQMFQEARGQTRLGLNGTIVKKLAIPLPPPPEQSRIVAEIDRQFSIFDSLERATGSNLARCTALRQSILKRAFEGMLVPQDPADEPASELLARIQAQPA